MLTHTTEAIRHETGVPVVLDTSFNLKGEAMLNTRQAAFPTFFSSGLDALVMNDVLVRKARA